MICRHSPGDPNCTTQYPQPQVIYRDREVPINEPDAKEYFVERCEIIGKNVILMVRYPSCRKCAYEGNKVMVYLNLDSSQIVFWKEIDPHFKDPKKKVEKIQAPPPSARFPASEEGWKDAIEWVRFKENKKK